MALTFKSLPIPKPRSLSPTTRAQLELHGERMDGEKLSAEARLDPKNDGAGWLYDLTWWQASARGERAVFELFHSNADCGAIFHAGTTRLVGLVTQGGFACTDLAAWEALGASKQPRGFPSIDFSLGEETGPTVDELSIGSAWRALRVVVAPWDPDGVVTRLLTATSDEDAPGKTGPTGSPLALFSRAAVARIHEVLETVPRDAVERRESALQAAIPVEDYRLPSWLNEKLDALRKVVRAKKPLIVRVA